MSWVMYIGCVATYMWMHSYYSKMDTDHIIPTFQCSLLLRKDIRTTIYTSTYLEMSSTYSSELNVTTCNQG